MNVGHETIKLIGKKSQGISSLTSILTMVFFEFDNKSKGEKSKSKQVGLHKTENLLYSKGNRQENEKVVKENTCKSCLKRSQYLKYTENSYYSMEKNPIKKMDRRSKQTFFKDDNK